MNVSRYTEAVVKDLNTYFSDLQVYTDDKIEDIVAPCVILISAAEIGPGNTQDTAFVDFVLKLYWPGDHGADVALELYSWAYRRLPHLRAPSAVSVSREEYDKTVGCNVFNVVWTVHLPNDYEFHPLIVDDVPIRSISISINGRMPFVVD